MAELIGFEFFKKQIQGGAFDEFCTLADVDVQFNQDCNITLHAKMASCHPPNPIEYLELSFPGILAPDGEGEGIFLFKESFCRITAKYYGDKSKAYKELELNKRLATIKSDFVEKVKNLDNDTPEMETYVEQELKVLGIH